MNNFGEIHVISKLFNLPGILIKCTIANSKPILLVLDWRVHLPHLIYSKNLTGL